MPKTINKENLEQMIAKAKEAASHSYSPYSHFPVGTCILTEDHKMVIGCNVENISFQSTVCSEVNAISSAIVHGMDQFEAMVIYTPTETPTLPCGNCRQVIKEFAKDIPIYCVYNHGIYETSLSKLLPDSFDGSSIKERISS